MKKLMTSTIIILPLLILAIMLVSSAIMGMVTHIYVETVEFTQSEALVLVMEHEEEPPEYDLRPEITVLPLKAPNRDLVFTSEDESLVRIDEDGRVTAVFYGETYVTVASKENRAATARRKVIVTDTSVHALAMNENYRKDLYEGETQQMSVRVYPQEAKDRTVLWSSSDESILHVGENGTVRAVGAGKATVKAVSAVNGKAVATAEIVCHKKVESLTYDGTHVITAYRTCKFDVKPNPAKADVTFSFETDDPAIATVDGEGNITFLREGHVTVTVTATDFGGHTVQGKKEFTSTDGYYLPPLFPVKEYTVDYDKYGLQEALPVQFAVNPEGAHREIVNVVCEPNVLAFDGNGLNFRFTDEMPEGMQTVRVTVYAEVYSLDTGTVDAEYIDGFTLNVLRDAQSVSVSYRGTETYSITVQQPALTFTRGTESSASLANVKVLPANHTNTFSYTLLSGEASLSENGELVFSGEGRARVKIALLSASGKETVSKELDVVYAPLQTGEKPVEIENGQTEEAQVALIMRSESDRDVGVIRFTEPAGTSVDYSVASGDTVVRLEERENGTYTIVALGGGFAEIRITVTPLSAALAFAPAEENVYTIKVYVDRPVKTGDFRISFNGTPCADAFRTSLGQVNFAASVADDNGSTAGKKLYVQYGETRQTAENSLSGEIVLAKDSLDVTVGVEYGEEVPAAHREESAGVCSVIRKLSTSRGQLDEPPTVTYAGGTLRTDGPTSLEFGDIGEEIVLTVGDVFKPADFDPQTYRPTLPAIGAVSADISADGRTVTLKAQEMCREEEMALAIGGKTFTLLVTVHAKAETVSVTCGDVRLQNGESYSTLLDSLAFRVVLGRNDGRVPDGETEFFNGTDWEKTDGGTGDLTVQISSFADGLLRFRSSDGGAEISFTVKKTELEEFGLRFSAETADGSHTLGVLEEVLGGETLSCFLPSDMRSVTATVTAEGYLGGLGTSETFGALLPVSAGEKWTVSYDGETGQIILRRTDGEPFRETLTFTGGQKTVTLTLSFMRLQSIGFTNFDSGDTSNGGDVYKGYQQVRLFAKQSDYGDGKGVVEYVRIPVVALSDLSAQTPLEDLGLLTWKFTGYKEASADTAQAFSLVQTGTDVLFNGTAYTVERAAAEGGHSLLKKDGQILAQNGVYMEGAERVPWVDVYAEEGYAHIYFGSFGGLTETDVQNDYFGNFGEKEGWSPVPAITADDNSGRTFTPSKNAYTFLRVEAGDGAEEGGKNCHFNFNVLEGADLVNVFNAAGYYAHSDIVLHENLYGPGELDGDPKAEEATAKGLILNSASLNKTLIYGNGYQVNLEAKTASMDKYSESDGITISRAYNTVIKCANPNDEISNKNQKMVFRMAYAYYCDLSYYYKFNPAGSAFYAKNTVFSNISKTAVQLYYNESMYVENCVFTECGTAIQVDNKDKLEPHIYIKGGFDALNYFNKTALDGLNPLIGLLYASVVSSVKDYLEWHGKTFTANANSYVDKNVDKIYVNILLFGYAPLTENMFVWDGDSYEKAAPLQNGLKIVSKSLYSTYYAWTYDTLDENGTRLDNATVDADKYGKATVTADMSQLFTEKRYIRLQCEYKGPGEKNYDHILWHKQNVYRDQSLIDGRKSHIEDLKETLKNTTWADGSYVDGEGVPHDPPAAASLAALISETVLPSKRAY